MVHITPYHWTAIVIVQQAQRNLLGTEVTVREKQNGLDLLIIRHGGHVLHIKLVRDLWGQRRNMSIEVNKKVIDF